MCLSRFLTLTKIHKSRRCFYCRKNLDLKTTTVDHFIPLSWFRKYRLKAFKHNTVLACAPCNYSKGDKLPWEVASGPAQ